MFDFVHNNKRISQAVLALIILPFAFWGVSSYDSKGADAVATVNGASIEPRDFEQALKQQQERLRGMLGNNFDAEMASSPAMRGAVLDNLISQRLLIESARSAGMVVDDARLASVISGIEAFQADGKFDNATYQRVLANQGMSPAMFEMKLREDMLGQDMKDSYLQNGIASTAQAQEIMRLTQQQRTIRTHALSAKAAEAGLNPSAEEIKAYYDAHSLDFQRPERAKVAYVTLSAKAIEATIKVDEAEAKQYFDAHQAEYGGPEQRQAAHILIASSAADPKDKQDAARSKAESVLKEVQAAPGKFAELAKKYSDDPGSATGGGDLGLFGRGMMVKPFDEAVFSMKQGETSGLVQSEFGYHIIKLTQIRPPSVPPFAQVRDQIMSSIRSRKAAERFAELAESFSNTVYEQSDTLEPAAKLIGGQVQQSDWLVKDKPGQGIWNDKMLKAVFADDVIHEQRNTQAIETGEKTLVAARLVSHEAKATLPLEQVSNDIRGRIIAEQAQERVNKHGEALLAALKKGEGKDAHWDPAREVTRNAADQLNAELLKQVFRAPAAGPFPQFVGTSVPGGYTLVRIDAVTDKTEEDAQKAARYTQQLRNLTGEVLFQSYLAGSKAEADIQIRPGTVPTN